MLNIDRERQTSVENKCAVCFSQADLKCSLCKEVSYCSKNHQKYHWKFHKIDCRMFEVCRDENGRHVVVNRDVKAGRVVVQEGPLCVGPRGPACLGCLRLTCPPTPTCYNCRLPVCTPACPGLRAPNAHLPECAVLALNALPALQNQFRYESILPLRCLLMQKLFPKKWNLLLSLTPCMEERSRSDEYKEADEHIVKFLNEKYLNKIEIEVLKDVSSETLHKICAIIDKYGLEISPGGNEAIALYPTFSLIEHSCVPNSKYHVRDSDLRMTVQAISDVRSGEKLRVVLVGLLDGTTVRQQDLIARGFSCACSRCSDPTELGTEFSTLKCVSTDDKNQACQGWLHSTAPLDLKADWRCSCCPAVLGSEHVSALLSSLHHQANTSMQRATVDKLEKMLENLYSFLHPNHFHCFTVKHTLIQLYGRAKGYSMHELSPKLLDRKIELSCELEKLCHKLDGGSGRLALYRGVALYELALGWRERARRSGKPPTSASQYLHSCTEVLKEEQEFSPGGNLLNLVKSTLLEVENELNRMQ